MSSKKFDKGSAEWAMFQDFWKLTQAFYIPEENQEYWAKFIDASDEFYEKHKAVPLSKKLSLALADALEEEWKRMKGG